MVFGKVVAAGPSSQVPTKNFAKISSFNFCSGADSANQRHIDSTDFKPAEMGKIKKKGKK